MTWISIFSLLIIHTFLSGNNLVQARRHHLEIRNDVRPYIALSTFGFYTGGHLDVKLSQLSISNAKDNDLFGLTLDKTAIDEMNPYLDSHQNKCILEEPSSLQHSGPILFFLLDFKNSVMRIQCSPEWNNQHIYKNRASFPMHRGKRQSFAEVSDSSLFLQRRKRAVLPVEETHGLPVDEEGFDADSVEMPVETPNEEQVSKSTDIPAVAVPAATSAPFVQSPAANVPVPKPAVITEIVAETPSAPQQQDQPPSQKPQEESHKLENNIPYSSNEIIQYPLCNSAWPLNKTMVNNKIYFNISFSMLIASPRDEGLYNLYFHACPNYRELKEISFNVDIEENNNGNFLSAGEMPLPALYFMMSLLFFLSGIFWVFILKKSKHDVYKIHWLMAVLVFLKSLSLMFHAINYHFIETRGEHVEAWAILYYITHLLKGAVLFITIVLIGTGWTFIKHILSDKDKKIFMIVIPLQVLANVAEIIIDESEEGDIEFHTWRSIFIIVDLVCCGAILFPIVWSIRHLCEASSTDGKAAINLRKLKLFRSFYIVIVCYIYFTRIIVYLLKMTVAFQYGWLDAMCHEMATYVFFVLTGYKFRPASSHAYFALGEEDTYDDEVEVLTESGLTEGLHRTKALNRNAPPPAGSTHTTIIEDESDLYGLNIKIAALWPDIKEEQYQSADQENYAEVYEKACQLRIGSIVMYEHENLSEIFKLICNAINIKPPNIQKIYRPNKSKEDMKDASANNNFPNNIIVQLYTPMDKKLILDSIAKFAQWAREYCYRHCSDCILDDKPPRGPFYIAMQYNAVVLDEIWKLKTRIANMRQDVRELQHQFAELEDYTTACKILINGIPFVKGEDVEQIFREICNTIKIEAPKMHRISRIYEQNKPTLIVAELWTPADKNFVLQSVAKFQRRTNQTLKLCHAGFKINNTPICIKDCDVSLQEYRNKILCETDCKLLINGIPFKQQENLPAIIGKICNVIKFGNMNRRMVQIGRLPDKNVFLQFATEKAKFDFVHLFVLYQTNSEPLKAYNVGFYIDCPISIRDYTPEYSRSIQTTRLPKDQKAEEAMIVEITCKIKIEGIPFDEHENLTEIFENICDVLLISPIKIQKIYRADCIIYVELCTQSDKQFVLESIVLFTQRTNQSLKLHHAGIDVDDKPFSVHKCETSREIFRSHIQYKELALEEIDFIHFKTQIDISLQEVYCVQHELAKWENYSTALELTIEGFPFNDPNIFKIICDTAKISPPKTLSILPQYDTAKEEIENKSAVLKVELWTPTDKKLFLQSFEKYDTLTYAKKTEGQKIICRSLKQYEEVYDDKPAQLKEGQCMLTRRNSSVITWKLKIEGVPYDARENLSMIFENLCNALEISQPWSIRNVCRLNDIAINVELTAPEDTFFFLDSLPTYMQFTCEQLKIKSNLQEKGMPIFVKVYNNETTGINPSDAEFDNLRRRQLEDLESTREPINYDTTCKCKIEGIPFDEKENLPKIFENLCAALCISPPLEIQSIARLRDSENEPTVIIVKLLTPMDKYFFLEAIAIFSLRNAQIKLHHAGVNTCADSPISIKECSTSCSLFQIALENGPDFENNSSFLWNEIDTLSKKIRKAQCQLAEQEIYTTACTIKIENVPFADDEYLYGMFKVLCNTIKIDIPKIQSMHRSTFVGTKPTSMKRAKGKKHRSIIVKLWTPADAYFVLLSIAKFSERTKVQLTLRHLGFGKYNADARLVAESRARCRNEKLNFYNEKIYYQRRDYRRAYARHGRVDYDSEDDFPISDSFNDFEAEEPESSSDNDFNVDPNIDVNTPIFVKEWLTPKNQVIFKVADQYKKQKQLFDVFVRRGQVYVKAGRKDTASIVYSLNMLNDFVIFAHPVKSIPGFEVNASD